MKKLTVILFLITSAFPLYVQAHKHNDKEDTKYNIRIERVAKSVSVIRMAGGNITVFNGSEGVFVVDNGVIEKSDKVQSALKKVTHKPVDYIVNTHWHFDHVGNNGILKSSGATILAHENVRERLRLGGEIKMLNSVRGPAPTADLPAFTYKNPINLYLNDEHITLNPVEPSHTDGDTFVVFNNLNIMSTGDLFFNGFWPVIDSESGGSLQGVITVIQNMLEMADAKTKIIPGHGPVGNKVDLQAYYEMLVDVENRIKQTKIKGLSRQAWIDSAPLEDLDAQWGQGFMTTSQFTWVAWDAYQ